MRTRKPLVTLKSALTLDGKIAAPEDNTGWITSERARAHVQELRHASDAIVTGIGTALSDNPLLTDRSGLPARARFCASCWIPPCAFPRIRVSCRACNGDLLVVATSAASPERRRSLENHGAEVKIFDGPRGRVDIQDLIVFSRRAALSFRDV